MPVIQCNCGALKLELTGDPVVSAYCHCDDCRAVHGAAYLPAAIYKTPQVRVVSGEPMIWSLRTTARASCASCGTRVYAEPLRLGVRSVPATLLPKGVFQPKFHMQCQFALIPVRDDLPHYKGYPAMLGGSDDLVGW